MASGKKKTKSKGKTLALNEFLQGNNGTPAPAPSSGSTMSWATEMDIADTEDGDEPRISFDRSKLPTAPKAARGPDVDINQIPDTKPYTAFVGNLPYDVSEDKIFQFFEGRNLQVEGVRLPSDGGRQRGFGYVEFVTKEDLFNALSCNEETFNGRKLRVDLAETSGGEKERGGDNSGRSDRSDWRGGGGDPDRTEGDWRRKDPPPPVANDRGGDRDRGFSDRGGSRGFSDRADGNRERRGFGDRDRDGFGDRGSDRGFDRRDGGGFSDRRGGGFEDRRGGGFEDRRGGGFEDRRGGGFEDRRGGGFEDRRGGGFERRGFEDWRSGGNDDRRGGGFEDRRMGGGGDRYGSRSGGYEDRGFGGRRDGYRRDDDGGGGRFGGQREDRGGSREASQDGPKERPRLNLQPRTKAVEKGPTEPSRQSSIFGSAKPVDTATKEREIEERMKKLDTSVHYPSEDGGQRDSYRDGGRTRRDSDGGRGGGRERRLSNSSARRDSETSSRHSDDSQVGDRDRDRDSRGGSREDRGVVPAPPPKENAWSRPRSEASARPTDTTRQLSSGSSNDDHGRRDREGHRDNRRSSEDESSYQRV